MPNKAFSVSSFSPARQQELKEQGKMKSWNNNWVTWVETPKGINFLAGLKGAKDMEGGLDEVLASALVADALRPGWELVAQPMALPIVMDGVIYRGFKIIRSSTVHGRGGRWTIDVLFPANLIDDFNWKDVAEELSGFHQTIFEPVNEYA